MNGITEEWSEYGLYRIESCLNKNVFKYHSKNPLLDFKKTLYTRYVKELNVYAQVIKDIDKAIKSS